MAASRRAADDLHRTGGVAPAGPATAGVSDDREHVDVLIVGAGLSGIGLAVHLRRAHRGRTIALLEARAALGGTWDLFRYPGVRSDSDMASLGFAFHPWNGEQAIADGPNILGYLRETAQTFGITPLIRYRHRVVGASFSTAQARWTVEVEITEGDGDPPRRARLTCDVLAAATGYYAYDHGYEPEFPGAADFRGTMVHPQRWPADLDHAGARIVVIGSGATAVTLVPALAATAAHVTMLQRSPTYYIAMPKIEPQLPKLRRFLPDRWAGWLVRWRNILAQALLVQMSRSRPDLVRRGLLERVRKALPDGYDLAPHFTPSYGPWDQRLCVVPDNDLFKAIRAGTAEIVTDHIETFTPTGIRLASGQELPADIIVSATGLRLKMFDGIPLTVDGERVRVSERRVYKSLMLEGVPNFLFVFGYTNASWTLKVDLVGEYLARLLRYVDRHRHRVFVPIAPGTDAGQAGGAGEATLLGLSSGYVLRGASELPRQGTSGPWRTRMSYLRDIRALRFGRVYGPDLCFDPVPPPHDGDAADMTGGVLAGAPGT